MSFIGRLFGSDKAVESLINGASNSIDKLFYTDEEKAEDKAKSASEARSMVVDWLKNTQGQNLSRRLIALAVTFSWILLKLLTALLGIIALWASSPESAKQFIASAEVIRTAANDMGSAVMLILGFYFAAPHMGSIATAALSRFGRANAKTGV